METIGQSGNGESKLEFERASTRLNQAIFHYLESILNEGMIPKEIIHSLLAGEAKSNEVASRIQAILHLVSVKKMIKNFIHLILDEKGEFKIEKKSFLYLKDISANHPVGIDTASILHDLGKTDPLISAVVNSQKSAKDFVANDWNLIRMHPEVGAAKIIQIDKKLLDGPDKDLALIAAIYHHEKGNGEGYPDRKHLEEIPIFGRLFAIMDVFDAITGPRYKASDMRSVEETIKIMEGDSRHSGQFDDQLFRIFKENAGVLYHEKKGTILNMIHQIREESQIEDNVLNCFLEGAGLTKLVPRRRVA